MPSFPQSQENSAFLDSNGWPVTTPNSQSQAETNEEAETREKGPGAINYREGLQPEVADPEFKRIAPDTLCTYRHVIYGEQSPLAFSHLQYDNKNLEQRFSRGAALTLMFSLTETLSTESNAPSILDGDTLFLEAIQQSSFSCIGQFLAATKALLFERSSDYVDGSSLQEDGPWQTYRPRPGMSRAEVIAALKQHHSQKGPVPAELYNAPLFCILRAVTPHTQFQHTKRIKNFDESVWRSIADRVMVAAIICRSEQVLSLREIILGSGNRKFANAKRVGKYWSIGVELKNWKNKWTGKNRLGWCYGRAREYMRLEDLTDGENDGVVEERF
ncbi:hypothetical protein EDD37DRAFT_164327 [Exophiala viscosa]|uniref:NADAR domain-containing protein n=1 Tax=Exophiala viscosa TaxID=2486360 RepID=A0AAN6I9Z2_9EURO|nr:hypothetical protein EDD36DRAFT_66782 [Exophiala viscosa]KAI1620671.1 hypothetical protein EDD37DRAFT_164327 [Exophiala viscosa]